MLKQIVISGLLLFAASTHAMLYDEDSDSPSQQHAHVLLLGALTHAGERYPIHPTIQQQRALPAKKDRDCLSLLQFLLQLYENAQPYPILTL